jgi:hypothetical protein
MLLVRYLHVNAACNFTNLGLSMSFHKPIFEYRKVRHAFPPTGL